MTRLRMAKQRTEADNAAKNKLDACKLLNNTSQESTMLMMFDDDDDDDEDDLFFE